MKKPLVAIVGRPNVGKSTFFNRINGKRISIVEDTPGVTRDRIYADAEWCGHYFTMVDTGGLDFSDKGEMQRNIFNQAQIAMDLADVILLMVDGKQGLVSSDIEIAEYLRKSKKPIVLAVNKIDNNEVELTYDFYKLNLGEPYAISSAQPKGLGDVLDAVVANFERSVKEGDKEPGIKIAIVGKPNAGKSSLTNKILGEERVVVSSIAGTTRDAIDTPFRYNGKDFVLIDTAGMRKKSAIDKESVERYSIIRALEAVKRSDIVLVMIDANEGISEQDVKIAGFVHEQNKPSIIVVNKWDVVEKDDKTINEYNARLSEDLKFMGYFVPLYVSALTGQRLNKIMPTVEKILENTNRRITTGVLNDIIQQAITVKEPPITGGRRLKIMFATQVSVAPPTFVLFVNDAKLIHFSYQRYLENCIRRSVDFSGTPIKLVVKSREDKD
ncbi:MAG: ribosome biogenesis GTPase Der [Christensenellaceae bacterium]|jgi:GTP-binding protein|nr:ribosome biogenesis GTPase Der [Christensenellaceae bacterium]